MAERCDGDVGFIAALPFDVPASQPGGAE